MKKYRFLALLLALVLTLPTAAFALEDPAPAATAAILVDNDNREVLYGHNAHEHRFPASITKVMTAMLVLEAVDRGELSLDDMITASDTYQRDLAADGSTQNIKPGETMSLRDLLYCTLVASANEACNILAEAVSGSITEFVALMNERAAQLGMEDTHFTNTHGLHNADHYTSAYDIWLMTSAALEHATFREMVSCASYRVPATNLSDERLFYNTNALITSWRYLGYTYSYAIGVKTGTTPEAGQCLVSAAVKDGRTLVCVILGAANVTKEDGTLDRQSFSESKRMLEWGFENFSRQTVLDNTTPLDEVEVTLSAEVASVLVKPQYGLEATLPNDADPESFRKEVTLTQESIQAPVEAGQVLGSVTVSDGDTVYGTIPLVAVTSVERSETLYRLHLLKEFFGQTWVKVVLVVVAVLVLILILRFTLFKPRRRRKSGYGGSGYSGRARRRR